MPQRDEERGHLLSEWLRRAEDDIKVVELLLANETGLATPIAFHAQQAVEKYLKAYLTWHQVPFPKTHDIERLLVLVESINKNLVCSLADTTVLTLYAVEVRYPGDMAAATNEEAQDAVALMCKARDAILSALPGALE
ncbi:MAG: HEPN domain protein [Candidatus Hydrogenedentes bacterium ADurb.Bin101]|jgi:HEPN domain-containing protein|nr:MAG: HEPN domain protein [Candidatus Hydrogenedentes bacterium ADurb.Bin101]HOC67519.1 HEPN domain-containing protein [Candidatus Hydrogenedentota bacterium]